MPQRHKGTKVHQEMGYKNNLVFLSALASWWQKNDKPSRNYDKFAANHLIRITDGSSMWNHRNNECW
jgi:hypothetical protein